MDLPSNAPAPRLCHLVKWPDFDGYGFNLHAEKAKTGQFIGKVDDGSPAELAGLKEGDRIIEVNGVNIANENHRQVVERIKAMSNETKLLVLDEEGDKYYKERKLVVKGTQASVVYKKTPPTQPSTKDKGKPVIKEEVKLCTAAPIPVSEQPQPVNGESSPKMQVDSAQEKKVKTPVQEKNVKTPAQENKKVKTPVQEKKVKTPSSPKKSTPEQNGRRMSNESQEIEKRVVNGTRESPAIEPSMPKKKADSPKPATKAVAKSESPKQAPKSQNGSTTNGSTTKSTVTSTVTNGSSTNGSSNNGSAVNGGNSNATKNGGSQNGGSGGPASTTTGVGGGSGGDLNLNMSAAQMREMLANRKKRDPRNQSLDMREKYQIVQQM